MRKWLRRLAVIRTALRRARDSSLTHCIAIGSLVFLCILGLRASGNLQSLELVAYDWLIRTAKPSRPAPTKNRVALVTVTEEDIRRLGHWPIPNLTMAEVLERILQSGPRAVGVDIYLDLEIPPGREQLDTVLTSNPNIIAVMQFRRGDEPGVPPPPVLENTEQVGFTDMLVDPRGIVRRGLMFLDDGQALGYSLALRLALVFLQAEGLAPQPDPKNPQHIRLGETTVRPLEPDDGGYVGADAAGYQFLVDYRDESGSFPSVSLTQLLAGDVDPALFRDKIVLMGVTAQSAKDVFFTPLKGYDNTTQRIDGIVLHAHITSQLLRFALDGDKPIDTRSDFQEALWMLAWSVAGGLLGLAIRSPLRFALSVVGGLALLYGVAHGSFTLSLWIPVVAPSLAWLLSATVATAYVSYQEMKNRTQIMNLFSRHISEQLALDIWNHRAEFLSGGYPRPQKLVATVFFSDVQGFATTAEKLAPAELMDWLNSYMEAMTPIVNAHSGVLLRFIGDAIMAVFGIPVARTTVAEISQDAINAVDCALEMRRTIIEHNLRLQAKGQPLVGVRIGIQTGPTVAGSIGALERIEYDVHGDTVNTAARLEAFDKQSFIPDYLRDPCRILITEATLSYLGQRYRTEKVGEERLRGKTATTHVYKVLDRRDDAALENQPAAQAAQLGAD